MHFGEGFGQREAEARAFLAGGDIWFHDVLMAAGQADTVICHSDVKMLAIGRNPDSDLAAIVLAAVPASRFDGLSGVLEDVGHGLAELVAITLYRRYLAVGLEGIGDLGIAHFLQEQRLADEVDRIFLAEHRLRQAGERGKLVHHLAQIADLANDRVGQFVEQFAVDLDLAIIDKRRPQANVSQVMHIIGDVKDRTCVLVDDMVDTAGTLCQAAKALKEFGAKKVVAYCTHPVLSGPAIERLASAELDELVVTDTIPLSEAARATGTIRQLTIAGLLAESIRRVNNEESISAMFR